MTHLKVFGCVAYAHIPDMKRQKMDKKAEKLRFIGYSTRSKGYRLFNEMTRKVIVRRDAIFNEIDFNQSSEKGDAKQKDTLKVNSKLEERPQSEDNLQHLDDTSEESLRRSVRQRQPPTRYGIDEYADMAKEDLFHHSAYNVCQISEPQSIEEALKSKYAKEWKAAADTEYDSLIASETWELVELPQDRKAIGCKWVFKVKYGSDGKMERFKGRLVAKGYAQRYRIDYEETFSPVVRFSSIRSLLAFAVQNEMLIHQMDVVSAFLNGKLDEEIYMEQPIVVML